jgi:hypothetical protein
MQGSVKGVEGEGVLMEMIFERDSKIKDTWFLSLTTKDNSMQFGVYLSSTEAKELFNLMKEAGFK